MLNDAQRRILEKSKLFRHISIDSIGSQQPVQKMPYAGPLGFAHRRIGKTSVVTVGYCIESPERFVLVRHRGRRMDIQVFSIATGRALLRVRNRTYEWRAAGLLSGR